jgi:hypothetical protein
MNLAMNLTTNLAVAEMTTQGEMMWNDKGER